MQVSDPNNFGLSRTNVPSDKLDLTDLILQELVKKLILSLRILSGDYSIKVVNHSAKVVSVINNLVSSLDELTLLKTALHLQDINMDVAEYQGYTYLVMCFDTTSIGEVVRDLMWKINFRFSSQTESPLLDTIHDNNKSSIVILKLEN